MSDKFKKIYEESIKNPEKFWQEASNDIFWFKKPTKILNKSKRYLCSWGYLLISRKIEAYFVRFS